MDFLKKIVQYKKNQIGARKLFRPIKKLEESSFFERNTFIAKDWLLDPSKSSIIAEYKRKSPSKGTINDRAKVEEVAKGYFEAGASAISVLTDAPSFGGKEEYLTRARQTVDCPLLRKDFIIDEYQLYESKAIGADIILLIATILKPQETKDLGKKARELDLNVLLEVHSLEELNAHSNETVDLLGVNNRDLNSFEVDIQSSISIAKYISDDFVKVSESGIADCEDIFRLKDCGFQGFLIGEKFMRTDNPVESCREFITKLKKKESAHAQRHQTESLWNDRRTESPESVGDFT